VANEKRYCQIALCVFTPLAWACDMIQADNCSAAKGVHIFRETLAEFRDMSVHIEREAAKPDKDIDVRDILAALRHGHDALKNREHFFDNPLVILLAGLSPEHGIRASDPQFQEKMPILLGSLLKFAELGQLGDAAFMCALEKELRHFAVRNQLVDNDEFWKENENVSASYCGPSCPRRVCSNRGRC